MSSASRQSSFPAASSGGRPACSTRSLKRETLAWCFARLWRTVQAIFSSSIATAAPGSTRAANESPCPLDVGRCHRLIRYPMAATKPSHRSRYLNVPKVHRTPSVHGPCSKMFLEAFGPIPTAPFAASLIIRPRSESRASRPIPQRSWLPDRQPIRGAPMIDVSGRSRREMAHGAVSSNVPR